MYCNRTPHIYCVMKLAAVQDRRSDTGLFFAIFEDDDGEVKANWPVHCQGDARRSLGIDNLDNAHEAVGQTYRVWFNVNSIPTRMELLD